MVGHCQNYLFNVGISIAVLGQIVPGQRGTDLLMGNFFVPACIVKQGRDLNSLKITALQRL